jgi:hypothetical protein
MEILYSIRRLAAAHRPAALAGAMLLAPLLCAGCYGMQAVDVKPLEDAGMNYDALSQLKALKISAPEVSQIAGARQAGFSDTSCVQVMQIYRTRNQGFDAGDSIVGLVNAGVGEPLVLDLARMGELGPESGELEAMRLAGFSDDMLLTVAQRHSSGQPVLSGASLAGMKNLGMRSDTLLQLARRGVPDSQASAIMRARRHGAKDADILKGFAGAQD